MEQESREILKEYFWGQDEIIGKELIDHLIHLSIQNLIFRNCGLKRCRRMRKVEEGEEEEGGEGAGRWRAEET